MNDTYVNGQDGATVVVVDAGISSWLAGIPAQVHLPGWVLLELGVNDMTASTTEAAYKTALGHMLDTLHAAWPDAQFRVGYPWKQGFDAQSDTMAGWIDNVLASRASYSATGPDERAFLKGADDGSSNTFDGIHPNATGYDLWAAEWKTAMGY